MNIIQEIKYRWKHGKPSPHKNVIWETVPEEEESVVFLRRLRGLMGYGQAWTFLGASWDSRWEFIALILFGLSFYAFYIKCFR